MLLLFIWIHLALIYIEIGHLQQVYLICKCLRMNNFSGACYNIHWPFPSQDMVEDGNEIVFCVVVMNSLNRVGLCNHTDILQKRKSHIIHINAKCSSHICSTYSIVSVHHVLLLPLFHSCSMRCVWVLGCEYSVTACVQAQSSTWHRFNF